MPRTRRPCRARRRRSRVGRLRAAGRRAGGWAVPALRRAATLRPRSLDRSAEDGGRIEIDLTSDEPAGDIRAAARLDQRIEAFARRLWDRHEDGVRRETAKHPADLIERPDDGDGLDPAAA